MKADKDFYLQCRNLFIRMGLNWEVKQLDIHFGIVLITDKNNKLISIR